VGRDNRYKVEFEDGTTTTIKAWNYRRAWRLASRTGRKVVRVWQDKSISEKLMALGEVPQRCSLKFPTQAAVA
jgi:hypothetical protein